MDKKRHSAFWAIAILLCTSIFLVNQYYGNIVLELITEQRYEVLNQWSGGEGRHLPDFYIGKIGDQIVGPLSNLVYHLVFVCFCLFYLKESSTKNFCLFVFLFLIATKFQVLFYPPYGDAIGGPFAEAIWLKRNSFDYIGLFHQLGYAQGGPKVYFFSIYPSLLALLMTIIPSTKAFLMISHLFVFIMAAVIVTVSKLLLEKVFDKTTAIISSVILLSLPLFQSQLEAINMEMPSVFFAHHQ